MSNTKYAFATGGTPITTWLINQIECVLEYEKFIINIINTEFKEGVNYLSNNELFKSLEEGYNRKKKLLLSQVNELKEINYNINLVYMKNDELNLDDTKI